MKLTLFLVGSDAFQTIMGQVDRHRLLNEEIYFLGNRYQFSVCKTTGKVFVTRNAKDCVAGVFTNDRNISDRYRMYVFVREFFTNIVSTEGPSSPEFNKGLEKYDIEYRETREFVKTHERFCMHSCEIEDLIIQEQKKYNLNEYFKVVEEVTERARECMKEFAATIEAARLEFLGKP